MDGLTPNEGRVDYLRSEATTWVSVCNEQFGSEDASVICRQLGHQGANNVIIDDLAKWPFGIRTSIGGHQFKCVGGKIKLCMVPNPLFYLDI